MFTGLLSQGSTSELRLIAVLESQSWPDASPPPDFRVLAVVPVYNEEDVVEQTLRYLIAEGIDVHLLDNWSNDRTMERAQPYLGRGVAAIERFPADGPSATYDLQRLMRRVEQISARASWAAWIMLHDADERRRSPWPGIGLRDALWRVESRGFSCVDHVTLNFCPVDDSFDPDRDDLERHFKYFEFSDHEGHFHQRRAWRRPVEGVSLAPSAGHDVAFRGRRVFPYKFLLKHFPIRSQSHGERKILRERVQRWNQRERELGWHRQYDALAAGRFTREAHTLLRFDPDTFASEYLIERLSAVGVYQCPPPWATAPRW